MTLNKVLSLFDMGLVYVGMFSVVSQGSCLLRQVWSGNWKAVRRGANRKAAVKQFVEAKAKESKGVKKKLNCSDKKSI